MIKELLGAASALALFAGVAAAQDAATTTTPTTPPGATPTPPAEATMPTPPPATAAAPADAAPAGMPPTEQAVAPEPAAPPAATPVPAPVETAAPMPEPATPPPAAEPATSPAAPAVETAAPASAPEPAPAATAAAGSAGKPVSADDMMGRQVEGTDGQPIGRISDVLVDPASGRIQRLVIASGGFLGLGAKNVALEFDKVEVRPEGGIVAMGVTREAIEGMPEYDVAAETAPLDPLPEPPATTGAAGGIATPGIGAGGAVAPAPGQTAQ